MRGYEKYLDVLEKDKLLNLIHLADKVKCVVDITKSLETDEQTWISAFTKSDVENWIPDSIVNKEMLGIGGS